MIRTFRYILIVLLGIALLTVAMANRGMVLVRLLPDDLALSIGGARAVEVPLFVVIFAGIVVGLLIGFVWEWFREMKHRSTASVKSREVSRLERELAVLKDAGGLPEDDILSLLDKPKAR